jgi:hypothetical protein
LRYEGEKVGEVENIENLRMYFVCFYQRPKGVGEIFFSFEIDNVTLKALSKEHKKVQS